MSFPDFCRWISTSERELNGPQEKRNTEPIIVYVTARVRVRERKLAHAAGLAGFKVIIITLSNYSSLADISSPHVSFLVAKNCWEILVLVRRAQADLIHLFVNYDNLELFPVLCCASVPVVYDPYDCLAGMMAAPFQQASLELLAERLCFSHAAHVCARSLEPAYLRRKLGYRMAKCSYFPDYPWKAPHHQSEVSRKRADGLHVVYCGAIWPEDKFSAAEFGYSQYLEISRVLAEQEIHLHLYPAPIPPSRRFEEFFAKYILEAQQNPFLHLHRSVAADVLRAELRQYDAALHVFGKDLNGQVGRVTRAKLDYSSANKIFDYIEANLPVVIHNGRLQRWILRHYGYSIEIENLSCLRAAIIEFRHMRYGRVPDLESQSGRLGSMYRALIPLCAF